MWKRFWQTWTIDKPAAFGDRLYQMLVELAALLDRLTLRRVIAFIPVVILLLAYAHNIPLPPELMLVGDLLAYLDIFSILLLLSVIGRVSALIYLVRRMSEHVLRLASLVHPRLRHRVSRRHPRPARKPPSAQSKAEDDPAPALGLAWA